MNTRQRLGLAFALGALGAVVGRFLEHSRVYYFAHGATDTRPHADADTGAGEGGREDAYFIGSADWMTRNLDERVEAVTPVEDPDLRDYLDRLLETMLADDRKAWAMNADGTYDFDHPDDGAPVVNAQEAFMGIAAADAPAGGSEREGRRVPDAPLTPAEISDVLTAERDGGDD